MTYPLPLDEQSIVGRQYRVNSLPSTFFIDRDGIIRYVHIGILNGAVLEERISELLSG
jgi:peroxiredoxin